MTAAAGTSHSSSCEATDRCTFSRGHSVAMGRKRCRATPTLHGDRLLATHRRHSEWQTGGRKADYRSCQIRSQMRAREDAGGQKWRFSHIGTKILISRPCRLVPKCFTCRASLSPGLAIFLPHGNGSKTESAPPAQHQSLLLSRP
jgi:hypothetical protein